MIRIIILLTLTGWAAQAAPGITQSTKTVAGRAALLQALDDYFAEEELPGHTLAGGRTIRAKAWQTGISLYRYDDQVRVTLNFARSAEDLRSSSQSINIDRTRFRPELDLTLIPIFRDEVIEIVTRAATESGGESELTGTRMYSGDRDIYYIEKFKVVFENDYDAARSYIKTLLDLLPTTPSFDIEVTQYPGTKRTP
ncbi:MAG: hypothetical protein AAF236_02890 [Verrucomicrobiota bacterium]